MSADSLYPRLCELISKVHSFGDRCFRIVQDLENGKEVPEYDNDYYKWLLTERSVDEAAKYFFTQPHFVEECRKCYADFNAEMDKLGAYGPEGEKVQNAVISYLESLSALAPNAGTASSAPNAGTAGAKPLAEQMHLLMKAETLPHNEKEAITACGYELRSIYFTRGKARGDMTALEATLKNAVTGRPAGDESSRFVMLCPGQSLLERGHPFTHSQVADMVKEGAVKAYQAWGNTVRVWSPDGETLLYTTLTKIDASKSKVPVPGCNKSIKEVSEALFASAPRGAEFLNWLRTTRNIASFAMTGKNFGTIVHEDTPFGALGDSLILLNTYNAEGENVDSPFVFPETKTVKAVGSYTAEVRGVFQQSPLTPEEVMRTDKVVFKSWTDKQEWYPHSTISVDYPLNHNTVYYLESEGYKTRCAFCAAKAAGCSKSGQPITALNTIAFNLKDDEHDKWVDGLFFEHRPAMKVLLEKKLRLRNNFADFLTQGVKEGKDAASIKAQLNTLVSKPKGSTNPKSSAPASNAKGIDWKKAAAGLSSYLDKQYAENVKRFKTANTKDDKSKAKALSDARKFFNTAYGYIYQPLEVVEFGA